MITIQFKPQALLAALLGGVMVAIAVTACGITTAPPVTAPPVTAPPVTAPPVTAPPGTAPPVTAPPGTGPPGTAPPGTAPPDVSWQGDRSQLAPVAARSTTGSHITLTDNLRPHRETVRIGDADTDLILDPMELECHDGRASITWSVGNLEPIVPDTGIHLSARLDGVVIGSIIRGSTRGIWNDMPVELLAVVDCPMGTHTLDLRVDAINGAWGIPYVVNIGEPPSLNLLVN